MLIPANFKRVNTYSWLDAFISDYAWIDKGVEIEEGVYIYHFTVIRDNVKIGAKSIIGHNCTIEKNTIIGEQTTIQSNTHITAEAIIGNKVFIGPGVTMCNEKEIAALGRMEPNIEGPVIGNGVRIGAHSLICPGVRIGENAFILSGTRVTKDIPAGEIWGPRENGRACKIGKVPKEQMI